MEASEIVKSTVEDQAPSMELGEFMKSLKGGKDIRQSLNAMFREELCRLPDDGGKNGLIIFRPVYRPAFSRVPNNTNDKNETAK